MKESFHQISVKISKFAGSTLAFALAILGILIWIITGPIFNFSTTWLVSIGTITDVVIFIMVFSVQYSQSRDSKAIQLKLNELIVTNRQARDTFIGLESLTDDEINQLDQEFKHLVTTLEPTHPIHKLHKKISQEKEHRFNITNQAGHLVGSLLSPFIESATDKHEHSKKD